MTQLNGLDVLATPTISRCHPRNHVALTLTDFAVSCNCYGGKAFLVSETSSNYISG